MAAIFGDGLQAHGDPVALDYYTGIRAADLASCCADGSGQISNLTSTQFAAAVPEGFTLPAAISAQTTTRCHIDSPLQDDRAAKSAACVFADVVADEDMWVGLTVTLANGTVLAETSEKELTTYPARGAGAAGASGSTPSASGATTSPSAHASSAAGAAPARFGVVALVGLAAATVMAV
ncbi:uncharacterized protein LOC62_02G001860 [Vanrija pseudolonga]|uniref:Uncharacterized protein n=1 Tax=Vanrija pseudolonga TaxID=143232 RepID=A0AAF1BNN5_9TREE|nr:hypothetical protein LOC62_02G001860 [Vanrija pseudolonga]